MTFNIIIREQAKMDLINIIDYISILIQNPHSANKISSLIIESLKSLEMFPYRHLIVIENIRKMNINNFNIYYKVEKDNVIILRILGSRKQFNYYDVFN